MLSGPSRTVVGEGILVILQGGSSRHLVAGSGRTMMSVQGLGFPGCSSHLNGTEAMAWSGGVAIPDGCSGERAVAAAAVAGNGNLNGSSPLSSLMFVCNLGVDR